MGVTMDGNVIDFQGKVIRRHSEIVGERGDSQYLIELEHENLELRDTVADMALELFRLRQHIGA